MLIDRPHVYPESSVPLILRPNYPNLINIMNNRKFSDDNSNSLKFNSVGGLNLIKFAKSK